MGDLSEVVRQHCAGRSERTERGGGGHDIGGPLPVEMPGEYRRVVFLKVPKPVTVTKLPVTRCQICHRTVAYRPGSLSEVLTEHYRRAHPEALGLPSQ
jgi:hypothetical protein